MDIFIARQPIFSRQKKLFGYELLHRGSMDNIFPGTDSDRATSNVVSNTFLNIGLDKLVSSKWALINFTEQHLLDKTALTLPASKIIVEILEHVPPTPEIVQACMELKEKGYVLALDDFVFAEKFEPLIDLADIIKIDFLDQTLPQIKQVKERLKDKKIKFLAEKVETYAQFDAAWKMGFSLFQGYFFNQPEVLKNKEIPASQVNLLSLLAEVNKKNVDLDKVEQLIIPDVSVSYKLLRYINSAYYYLLNEVTSIKHALIYLGVSGTRQFVSLVATSELSSDKPDELLRTSIIRARLCELLAGCGDQQYDTSEVFLLGLFSLLHAMLDMKMVDILERLPLSEHIKEALINHSGPFAIYLETTIAYENGDWIKCQQLLDELNITPKEMLSAYLDSVSWAELFTT